jgi:hypothetical protein
VALRAAGSTRSLRNDNGITSGEWVGIRKNVRRKDEDRLDLIWGSYGIHEPHDNARRVHQLPRRILDGHYDCVDRIVINAYCSVAQTGGGFRSWWRSLEGSDDTLDRAHIERMAGRFKRRLEGYCKKSKIPFLYCDAGERKHEKAEPYIPAEPGYKGIFLVLVGRAPAPVWEVQRNGKNQITNLYRKKKWPYVNHYHIHLMDPEWGHVTIRICGYPPFGAQVIANGHEWVERQARKRSLPVIKEGNCFTGGTDFQALNQIAKTLRAPHAVGRLTKVCDRWLYSACLCFALDSDEQKRSRIPLSVFVLSDRTEPQPVVPSRRDSR